MLTTVVMRLREIHFVLMHSIPSLRLTVDEKGISGSPRSVRLTNISTVRTALQWLAKIPGLEEDVAPLLGHAYTQLYDGAVLPAGELQGYLEGLAVLDAIARRLHAVIGKMIPPEDPLTLNIKLPEARTLQEFKDSVDRVWQALEDTSLRVTGQGLRFEHVDVGSSWIVAVAISKGVIAFVMGILKAAQLYREREVRLHMADEQLKAAGTSVQLLGALQSEVKEQLKLYRETLATELAQKHTTAERIHEVTGPIMHGIDNLVSLYARGAEVHRALIAAPPDVKAEFPDHSKLTTPLADPQLLLPPKPSPPSEDADDGETPDDGGGEPVG